MRLVRNIFIIIVFFHIPIICLGQGQVTRNTNSSKDPKQTNISTKKNTYQKNDYLMSQSERSHVIQNLENNMVYVKGGIFQMGTNDLSVSRPEHQVEIDDIFIGKYEITQEEWYAVIGHKLPVYEYEKNKPAVNFKWEDLEKFIIALNQKTNKSYRLPTEAEWEWAAQGGEKSMHYTYSGSNDVDEIVNRGFGNVGSLKPNELGLYDMSGNVNEFCSDYYGIYSSKFQINPTGPLISDVKPNEHNYYEHVIKGGDWYPIQYNNAHMYEYRPQFRSKASGSGNNIGFRLVLDVFPDGIDEPFKRTYIEAKQGNLGAMREITNHFLKQKNHEMYIKWLERLGVMGDSDGYAQLGKIYRDGVLTSKDLIKSEKYLSLAYSSGNINAKSFLGEVRNEIGLSFDKTNAQEAFSWFEKGAELGNAESQNNVGLYYLYGKGVAKNYNNAVTYFLLSANQDYYHALNNMGFSYLNGFGVPKNLDKAEYWYRKAAEKGHPDAKKMLKQIEKKAVKIVGSDDKEPLIGCTLKYYRNGKELFARASDIDGQFLIRDVKKGDVLRFEYIGYKSKEVTLNCSEIPQTLTFCLSLGSNKKTEYETKY